MSFPKPQQSKQGNVRICNPLDVDDWDSQLSYFPAATFFHSKAWARVLQSTYGYKPMYFVTGSNNRFDALLPSMEVDSWLTGRRGISLPFTDACEPLGEASAIIRLVSSAQRHAEKNFWKYLECRGGRSFLGDIPASASYYNHSLSLRPTEDALFAQLDGSVRQALRKAEQSKLRIEFTQSPAAIRTFYDLFCLTRQKQGVPPQPFAFFANIQKHVLEQNLGWIVLAYHGRVPVAGAVFFHFGKSAIYKFGASNQAFQHLRANNLVMWAAIRRYGREGFHVLDFGRTARHHAGLRRYKLSWGTQERRGDYFSYDIRKQKYMPMKEDGDRIAEQLCRHLPRFISRFLGLFLYKHVAALPLLFVWSQLDHCFVSL